ncbi:MAG: transglycosylase domain-containing protein, partial [Pseudomonadota bacterium]|nr:transglycosylase domain-containing protein [Pseudomonadota bacterium]
MIRRLLVGAIAGALLLLVLAAIGYSYVATDLPDAQALRDVQLQVPLRIYSGDGLLIGEFGEQKRVPVAFDDLPKPLIEAVLAAEDDRFFHHAGVDYAGLLRAVVELVRTGEKRQGGSTITMQVARNFFLGREKTYLRKAKEIVLAIRIEHELSKREIFELYANKIFLGHRAYGFAAAAQVYFDAPLDRLDVADLALLAGLPKAPSRFNPVADPERARIRRDYVLARMLDLDFIDAEEYRRAREHPITARLHQLPFEVDAPHLSEMARIWALDQFGPAAYSDGLSLHTTISAPLQRQALIALQQGLRAYDRRHGYRGALANHEPSQDIDTLRQKLTGKTPSDGLVHAIVASTEESTALLITRDGLVSLDMDAVSWARPYIGVNRLGPSPRRMSDLLAPGDEVLLERSPEGWRLAQWPQVEGALVALSPDDGAIRALVGGYDFSRSLFNRVIQADRQPGSNFKPFVYAAALDKGFTPASLVNDAPVVFHGDTLAGDWRPENYSGRFFGPTRLRVALAQSRNLVTVRLAADIGIDKLREYVARFGFPQEKLPRNLSLALGSGALTPLEIARGYAILANGGFLVEPHFVEYVVDQRGEVVWTKEVSVACRSCPGFDAAVPQEEGYPSGHTSSVFTTAPRVQPAAENFILTTMLREVIR